jgi:hypothetical protein
VIIKTQEAACCMWPQQVIGSATRSHRAANGTLQELAINEEEM